MNLKQLKYFVTVAEELHFGRAAQRLHISQPPLSMSIQQLENNIGFALFVRNNKNVALTDAGKLFYQEAIMLLRHAEDMQQIGKRVAHGTFGQLRIGFTSSMLFRGLGEFVHQFQSRYPHIRIILKEMNSSEQIQALKQELINLGFVHTLNQEENFAHRLFLSEAFVCCIPKNHFLAEKSQIHLGALRHENFVLFPRSVAPHYYDQITAMCVNAGFSPYIAHEIRNWLTIVELVEAGMGVALVPASMKALKKDNVSFVDIDKNNICSETFCIWKKNHSSILLDHFLETLPFPA
ncbi:LysR family transcriptional regulator [Acinetobacter stercoris]|uniref:HTH-type transcriptional regulator BenM n=1 Tax=Acinetobacter stercoris TaxID=2126983 RepID=A0A2U3N425_9GAMM|nr:MULTISPECIES: LysR family transcriptional regulator [Acinetobacter]SPL72440.1 HTH-type transcriptional regulator BenM [Acinetobacter stercoris]